MFFPFTYLLRYKKKKSWLRFIPLSSTLARQISLFSFLLFRCCLRSDRIMCVMSIVLEKGFLFTIHARFTIETYLPRSLRVWTAGLFFDIRCVLCYSCANAKRANSCIAYYLLSFIWTFFQICIFLCCISPLLILHLTLTLYIYAHFIYI
jgi:hypothetical protein